MENKKTQLAKTQYEDQSMLECLSVSWELMCKKGQEAQERISGK